MCTAAGMVSRREALPITLRYLVQYAIRGTLATLLRTALVCLMTNRAPCISAGQALRTGCAGSRPSFSWRPCRGGNCSSTAASSQRRHCRQSQIWTVYIQRYGLRQFGFSSGLGISSKSVGALHLFGFIFGFRGSSRRRRPGLVVTYSVVLAVVASSCICPLTRGVLFVVVQLEYVRETKNCSRLLDLAMDANLVCHIHVWLTSAAQRDFY
jgi:hypothetical protein